VSARPGLRGIEGRLGDFDGLGALRSLDNLYNLPGVVAKGDRNRQEQPALLVNASDVPIAFLGQVGGS
jgi:hypothetical protein